MIIDSLDQHCRYLFAPGSSLGYSFGNLLQRLGVFLDDDQLRDMVRYGWIQPVLRIRLPERFFTDWENYPYLSFEGVSAEYHWAQRLFAHSAAQITSSTGELTGNWYTHCLDEPNSELASHILSHAIPTCPGSDEPPSFRHPRWNHLIYPWLDFFAYWQAYEIVDVLRNARLIRSLLNEPDLEEHFGLLHNRLSDLRRLAEIRTRHAQSHWASNRTVFDWISRFRTLLGFWSSARHAPWAKAEEAAPHLLAEIQITPEQLKEGIRDVLLTQWRTWSPLPPREEEVVPLRLRAHLQQDIQYAVDFLGQSSGQEVDVDDPYWGEGTMRRSWAPLREALPYETLNAKQSFPVQASLYLDDLNRLLGEDALDESRLKALVDRWWFRSVAVRRLCLAFQRLHEHLRSEKEDKVGLRAQTPVDFLILCTLHTEKIIRDYYLEFCPTANQLPNVQPLVKKATEEIFRARGIPNHEQAIKELSSALQVKAKLHALHFSRENPFVSASHFASGGLAACLLTAFTNFVVLRNYAAHHDFMDDKLAYTPMARVAVKAVLVPALIILDR